MKKFILINIIRRQQKDEKIPKVQRVNFKMDKATVIFYPDCLMITELVHNKNNLCGQQMLWSDWVFAVCVRTL